MRLVRAQLAHRLFDVTVEAADGQVPVWHKDVRFFALKAGGKPKAYFYLGALSLGLRLYAGEAWSLHPLLLLQVGQISQPRSRSYL